MEKIFPRAFAALAFIPALIFLTAVLSILSVPKAFKICMESAREWWK